MNEGAGELSVSKTLFYLKCHYMSTLAVKIYLKEIKMQRRDENV